MLKINKTLRINRNIFKVKNFDLKVKPLISLHISLTNVELLMIFAYSEIWNHYGPEKTKKQQQQKIH